MTGPGKYDAECTATRKACEAVGCILIIAHGREGNGFSVQAPEFIVNQLPAVLREVADQIEYDIKHRN